MRSVANVAGALLVGGALIGVWLYFILFEAVGTSWTWWGLVGLVLGGGAYATRYTDPTTGIWIWVAIGIAAGIAVTAAFVREDASLLAGVLTGAGSAMIGRAFEEVYPRAERERQEPGAGLEAAD